MIARALFVCQKNQVHHARTKHIDVCFHFIREIISEWDIRLLKIGTIDNPADNVDKGDRS